MRRHRGQRWLGDRQAGAPRISAKLSYRREGERAPINGPIFDALAELIRTDHAAFIRHGIVQATGRFGQGGPGAAHARAGPS